MHTSPIDPSAYRLDCLSYSFPYICSLYAAAYWRLHHLIFVRVDSKAALFNNMNDCIVE
jgi:hypothetical protein